MEDNIAKIKDRLDIVDVISGYLKLQKSGINFKARCPFHNEKTPSFYVSTERQIWHCFGCSKGGDIFGFVKEIEGVEFPEAMRILAARAGIELEHFDSSVKDAKERLYEICEVAAKFFEKQLHRSNTGARALAYLRERGLKDETIEDFRLGFAPVPAVGGAGWEALSKYLADCGYSEKEIVSSGVALKRNEGNGIYDRFRSRIIFPISDANNRVVGFTGRIFEGDEKEAKYINTPQTLIYDKSGVLYGLNLARTDIRKNDRCIMVEGNMDAIMSHQAGVKNTVAASGTALTQNHLRLLQRHTSNLDLCFDADQAGAIAMRRGIGLALGQNFNVKIVELDDPACKDPADYVKKYGDKWVKQVASSRPVIDFYFQKAKVGFDPASAESKRSILAATAPFIKRLQSKIERSHWIAQLASFLRVKDTDVEADLATVKDDLDAYDYDDNNGKDDKKIRVLAAIQNAPDLLNEAFISLIIKNPSLFTENLKTVNQEFLNPFAAEMVQKAMANADANINNFISDFEQDKKMNLEFAYIKSQELWKDFSDDELRYEFQNIYNKLKQNIIRNRLGNLQLDIRAAEAAKDKVRISELASQFHELTRELAALHNA